MKLCAAYKLSVSYSGGTGTPENVATPYIWSPDPKGVSLLWYSFPDSSLLIPISLTTVHSDTLKEVIEATFVEQAYPVEVRLGDADIGTRTTVRKSATIGR